MGPAAAGIAATGGRDAKEEEAEEADEESATEPGRPNLCVHTSDNDEHNDKHKR